jgi:hypothetical protein
MDAHVPVLHAPLDAIITADLWAREEAAKGIPQGTPV